MTKPQLLLIVDIQKGFMTSAQTRAVVPTVNRLIACWESRGWPIVASRFVNLPNSNWMTLRDWREMQSEPETQLADELQLTTPYVFKKSTYSAWSEELNAVCISHDIRDIVIAGVDTNECVLASALGVFDAGFRPIVVSDACASTGGGKPHAMAIELLGALLGSEQLQLTDNLVD